MSPCCVRVLAIIAATAALGLPAGADAARSWLLPSNGFIESGSGPVPTVSIDAAVSEDLFEFDRFGLSLDGLAIVAPDGSTVGPEAVTSSRRRNSFDLDLKQAGTYRIANVSDVLMVTYKSGSETKRWRGPAEAMAAQVPAGAEDVHVTRLRSRVETFVTRDAAGGRALGPNGVGLEAVPLTNPTDLSVGDTTRFRLLHDGQPVADADVTVIRGGNRYRYKLGELALKTDAEGGFNITWPDAGRYWIGASVGNRGRAGGTAAEPARRATYSGTVEVLPK